jgi:cytochrome bd-type quinol oxidase subunit 2
MNEVISMNWLTTVLFLRVAYLVIVGAVGYIAFRGYQLYFKKIKEHERNDIWAELLIAVGTLAAAVIIAVTLQEYLDLIKQIKGI